MWSVQPQPIFPNVCIKQPEELVAAYRNWAGTSDKQFRRRVAPRRRGESMVDWYNRDNQYMEDNYCRIHSLANPKELPTIENTYLPAHMEPIKPDNAKRWELLREVWKEIEGGPNIRKVLAPPWWETGWLEICWELYPKDKKDTE